MWSPRTRSPRRLAGRRLAGWAALAVGWLLPSTGCQVEYAGMTLPSGKYMHDDVQYFAPGPAFPWANTQAATQRARMQAMGIDVPPPPGGPSVVQPAQGAIPPVQNQLGRPTDVNASPLIDVPMPAPPGALEPGVAPPPPPGGVVPPPGAAPGGAAPAPGGEIPAPGPPAGAVPAPGGVVPPPGGAAPAPGGAVPPPGS